MSRRRVLLASLLVWGAFGLSLSGQEATPSPPKPQPVRRALLVGINTYRRPALPAGYDTTAYSQKVAKLGGRGPNLYGDLDGCVNDVLAIKELLLRNGFSEENITLLKNEQATHAAILGEFEKQFITKSAKGDLAFFYYSGHGSRMRNSLSEKLSKLDETIVPVDSIYGAPDIRDKDFKRLMNRALDRGAVLTAIFDSCHSGGITRGAGRSREIEHDPRDAHEPPDGKPTPASRGALILSAAQDFEKSWEDKDEKTNRDHGAFTLALLNVLGSNSLDMSAQEVFTRVRAAIKIREIDRNKHPSETQEPVIETNEQRLAQPLLGIGVAYRLRPLIVQSLEGGEIRLQGGLADGLNPGCVLKAAKAYEDGSIPRLVVQEGLSLTSCYAKVQPGSRANIAVNDAFLLEQFVPASVAFKAGLPPALDEPGIQRMVAATAFLRDTPKWVEDPARQAPTHVLAWDGKAWGIRENASEKWMTLGARPTAKALKTLLAPPVSKAKKNAQRGPELRVYLQVPLSPAQYQGIQQELGANPSLVRLEGPNRSAATHYVLQGRVVAPAGGKPSLQYSWVRHGVAEGAGPQPGVGLPPAMPWQDLSDPGTGGLSRMAANLEALARLHGWLTLASPPQERFGYRLALQNRATGELRLGGMRTTTNARGERVNEAAEPPLQVGEAYALMLKRDPSVAEVQPRYVYIFLLDQEGRSQLFYPQDEAKTNRLPASTPDQKEDWPGLIPLKCEDINIKDPVGTDTYCLLTSAEPIPDLRVFNWAPEVDPSLKLNTATRGGTNPLARLIASGGTSRGGGALPTTWTLQRTELLSVSATKEK